MIAQIKNYSLFDKEDFDKNGIPQSLNGQVIYRGYVKGVGYVVDQIAEYKNGKKHGHFIYFIRGDFRGEEYYENGILNGYSSNGDWSGFYKKGERDRIWKYSDDTGNYEIITYKNGKKQGYYERMYQMIRVTGEYKEDKKDGEWLFFDEKGERLTKILYKEDIETNIEKL